MGKETFLESKTNKTAPAHNNASVFIYFCQKVVMCPNALILHLSRAQDNTSQGWSQDFILGGANVVKGPIPRVPPKQNKIIGLDPLFLGEGSKSHLQNKICGLGAPASSWRPWFVPLGPDSSCGALVHPVGPDSSRGPLIRLPGPDSSCRP